MKAPHLLKTSFLLNMAATLEVLGNLPGVEASDQKLLTEYSAQMANSIDVEVLREGLKKCVAHFRIASWKASRTGGNRAQSLAGVLLFLDGLECVFVSRAVGGKGAQDDGVDPDPGAL